MDINRRVSTPIAITIIIVLAVVIGGGVLAWQYWWQPETPTSTPPPIPTPSPADETAGWKTYSWNIGPIIFKYPSNWEVKESSYTTPAGFTSVVSLDLFPKGESITDENSITMGGRQVSCEILGSQYRCFTFNGLPIYTISKDSSIIRILELIYKNSVALEEVKIGKIEIDNFRITDLQKMVDGGYQLFRLRADSVLKIEILVYGFAPKDLETLKQISFAASAGVAEYEITHEGKIYIVTVIRPVPGERKIWTIYEIREK